MKNILKKLDWNNVIYNKNIPFSFLKKNINKIENEDIFLNDNVPISKLKKNISKLNLETIVLNPNIPISFFEKFKQKNLFCVFDCKFKKQLFLENKIHSFSFLKNDF